MSVKRRALVLLAWLLPLVATAGCVTASPAERAARNAGRLNVVTAFYPLQFLAQRVAGDHATVANLTQPGAEPHDLELTPRQVASLTTANLVIYEKGFQPAVDEAVLQSENPEVIDTTTAVPLRPLTVSADEPSRGAGTGDDHLALDPHVRPQTAAHFQALLRDAQAGHAPSLPIAAHRASL